MLGAQPVAGVAAVLGDQAHHGARRAQVGRVIAQRAAAVVLPLGRRARGEVGGDIAPLHEGVVGVAQDQRFVGILVAGADAGAHQAGRLAAAACGALEHVENRVHEHDVAAGPHARHRGQKLLDLVHLGGLGRVAAGRVVAPVVDPGPVELAVDQGAGLDVALGHVAVDRVRGGEGAAGLARRVRRGVELGVGQPHRRDPGRRLPGQSRRRVVDAQRHRGARAAVEQRVAGAGGAEVLVVELRAGGDLVHVHRREVVVRVAGVRRELAGPQHELVEAGPIGRGDDEGAASHREGGLVVAVGDGGHGAGVEPLDRIGAAAAARGKRRAGVRRAGGGRVQDPEVDVALGVGLRAGVLRVGQRRRIFGGVDQPVDVDAVLHQTVDQAVGVEHAVVGRRRRVGAPGRRGRGRVAQLAARGDALVAAVHRDDDRPIAGRWVEGPVAAVGDRGAARGKIGRTGGEVFELRARAVRQHQAGDCKAEGSKETSHTPPHHSLYA